MEKRSCKNCGREFTPESGKQKHCCPECRTEYLKKLRIERDRRRSREKAKKRKKQKTVSAIVQVNREARACGMSYGKYNARKYAPIVKKRT